jgi:hypothetical protein
MNTTATFIIHRKMGFGLFSDLRTKAVLGSLLKQLLGRCSALSAFSDVLPGLSPDRSYAGIQNIRLEQITGSVGRAGDFDRDFRPLKAHLRDRWVSNYQNMQKGNSEAISVYRVGDQYFVEDGHHRVSVARATGMAFIEAEVWEYRVKPAQQVRAPLAPRPLDPWLALQPASSCSCQETAY